MFSINHVVYTDKLFASKSINVISKKQADKFCRG